VKYSIITPVFNSFSLMKKYFLSLERQTIQDFEVIVIDDCSTDTSFCELSRYCQSSKLNIRLKKTVENLGPGNARNEGINAANGEWIAFIDNDDWVEESFLEEMEKIINSYSEIDCVIFDYYKAYDRRMMACATLRNCPEGFVSGSIALADASAIHSKLIKRSLLNDHKIRYPQIRRCEDIAFFGLVMAASKKIYYSKKNLYYYFQRRASLSNNLDLDIIASIEAFSILEEKLYSLYPREIETKSVNYLLYSCVLLMVKRREASLSVLGYIISYEKKYPNWFRRISLCKHGIPKFIFFLGIKLRLFSFLRICVKINDLLKKYCF